MAYVERRERQKGTRYRGIYKGADGRYRSAGTFATESGRWRSRRKQSGARGRWLAERPGGWTQ